MATPANRILVVYVATAASAAQANAPVVDEVARRGCSGVLILPDKATEHDALHALLGVDTHAKENAGLFPFPKMPITVVSDSSTACNSVKSLGITDVQWISTTEPHEPITAHLESLLQPQDIKTKHLVFVHVTHTTFDHWVFKLVEKFLGSEETASSDQCFISIVRTAERPHQVDPAVAAHPLRPRQSYERHHGLYAAPSTMPLQRLLVSNYHCDRTRCDLVTRLNEQDVETHGAYGGMDARIFMKEMAFRLGFAPKYGA